MIDIAAPREVEEWIGRDADQSVPDRVRLRVYLRAKAACQICKRRLATGDRWTCDHVEAIINGGENRERNLQLICEWCNGKIKTPADVAIKAKAYKSRKRNLGMHKAKQPFRGWRKFSGEAVINPKAVRR